MSQGLSSVMAPMAPVDGLFHVSAAAGCLCQAVVPARQAPITASTCKNDCCGKALMGLKEQTE